MAKRKTKMPPAPVEATPVPPPPSGETEQVRLDSEIVRRARIAAPAYGISAPEYINQRLRQVLDLELPEILALYGIAPKK